MNKTWVQNFSDTDITLLGMFLFLAVFVGTIFFTYHRGRKDLFNKIQNIPLEENEL